jgi:hypothetical protein
MYQGRKGNKPSSINFRDLEQPLACSSCLEQIAESVNMVGGEMAGLKTKCPLPI